MDGSHTHGRLQDTPAALSRPATAGQGTRLGPHKQSRLQAGPVSATWAIGVAKPRGRASGEGSAPSGTAPVAPITPTALDGATSRLDTLLMRTALPPVLVAALALLLPSALPWAAAAPEAATARLRTLELSRVEGTLTALDATHVTLRAKDGGEQRFALADAVSLTLTTRKHTHVATGPQFRIWLTGGSQIVGRVAGGKDDILTIRSASLGDVSLLLDHVRTIEALPADLDPCHDLAAKHPRPEKGDLAYNTGGDQFAGAALEVTDVAILIETRGGRERSVPWKTLRVLHLENELIKPAAGLQTELDLNDGSRIATHAPAVLAGTALRLALRAVPKEAVSIALAQVRTLRWTEARFVYASDLPFTHKLVGYHQDPPGSTDPLYYRWAGARVDRRTDGCPLRMGGETFRHGFGVNSHSTVTIAIDGRYASFQTSFGIDDVAVEEAAGDLKRGDVDARILADGKVVWEAKGVKGGAKVHRVGPLDVRGVKVLVLEVGFGKEMMTRDRADWGNPILVKAAK